MRTKCWENKRMQTTAFVLSTLILLGVAACLIFTNLENQVIMAYDEARHGVSGYEMIRNNDYLVNTYQGEPDYWNLKPPISFWLIALNFQLFGYSCVAFRLHSVIATLATLSLVAWWVKKRHGSWAGLLALLCLVVNSALYGLNFARTGEADALHTLFVTISMLCMLNSDRDSRWLYGCALGFGLSFMTKSFHAGIIPVICLIYLFVTGGLKRLRLKHYLLIVAFALLPIVPWAVARYSRDGFMFLTQMFTTDVQARVVADVGQGQQDRVFYLLHIWANPVVRLSIILSGAVLLAKMVRRSKITHEQIGLMLWFALPIVLYSFSNFKLYHYIVPVMIPASIAGGMAALWFVKKSRPKWLKVALCVLLCVGVASQTVDNIENVQSRDDKGSMQAVLVDSLDRDIDSGKRMYIQYSNGRTEWMQNDMLRALLSGDVVCVDGGIEAFEEDELALLVLDKENADLTLMEYYPMRNESVNQYVFEN